MERHFKPQSRRGFALVTALSLMAFMLALVVTLLSLMEVETRSADNNLELQKAREGARLALNMAVGKLQEYAGNDQRVTARAEILGVDSGGNSRFRNEARYWTGVWRTDGLGTGWPKWLVSWHTPNTDPDPSSLPADSVLMLLAGPRSDIQNEDNYVYAPKIDVLDKNGNVSSRIAWWISDEGVKASVAQLPLNQRPATSPGFVLEASKNALETMLATSHGLESIFTSYDRFSSGEAAQIDLISNVENLVSQTSFTNNRDFEYTDVGGVTITEEIFHTLTPMSYGLLASTEPAIGLMQDLSLNSNLLGTEFTDYVNRGFDSAAAKAGLNPASLIAMQRSVGIHAPATIATLSAGDIVDLAAPVLTNFMLAFAVYYEDIAATSTAQVSVRFFSEFWNPYTSTLLMNDGTDDYALELEIRGLPSVNIKTSSGSTSGAIDLKLNSILNDPFVVRLVYDSSEAWHPGMTKNWTGISNSSSPFESTNTTTKDLASSALDIDTLVSNVSAQDDVYGISSTDPSNTLNISINLVNVTTDASVELAQINGIEYSTVNVPVGDVTLNDSNPSFGYQFILIGPNNSNDDPTFNRGVWLSATDPRNPSSVCVPTYNGLSPQLSSLFSPGALNSSTIDIDRPERLFDRSIGPDSDFDRLWQESPLFELPRERILSLASLQHLYFHNERPFKVGNSWGDDGTIDTLAWFDQYFFSGLSPSDTLANFTQHDGFPNPILTAYNDPDPSDFNNSPESVAQNALVSGRFNLNSTSVSAWKAVLGGLRINGWPYVDYYPEGDLSNERTPFVPNEIANNALENRSNLFARFSSTLHETYDVFLTPEDSTTVAPSEYYRRGVRYLTLQQVEDMAVNIVSQIRARGNPFLSIKDFLNNPDLNTGSIIEEAIQASVFTDSVSGRQQWDHSWETEGIGEDDDSDKIDIDHFSPGFLTQADIMTAIGPMLAPRSDTFKIRARCQTLSPFDATEVIGDATVEAIVQRVPEALDPDDDINGSIDRQFRIMSIRWLTEDEL